MESESIESERLSEDSEQSDLQNQAARSCCFKCPVTVEIITFGLFLAESLSGPVTANFILMKTCEVYFNYNKSICAKLGNTEENASDIESLVQPYSAVILTGMNFLTICVPAVIALFVGPWSDYNGRKPVVIVSALGYLLKFVLLAVFSWTPNIDPRFGLVAVLPVALTGGIVNYITAVYSYISDITDKDNRTFRIGILESTMYCSNIIGLLSVIYIFKSHVAHAYLLTYGLCASIIIAATVVTYFFVPESVRSTEGGKGIWHVFDPRLLKETLKVCFKRREGYTRAVIILSILSVTLGISAGVGEANVIYLFSRLRFGWTVEDFSLFASIISATDFFGLLLGSFLLFKWLNFPDAVIGFISNFMKAMTSFYIAFVPSDIPSMMYYSGLICIFGGLSGPSSRAVLSKSVPAEDLGKIFAVTGLSEALLPLAVGPLYTFIYNFTLSTLPGAFLFLSCSLFTLAGVFFVQLAVANILNTQGQQDSDSVYLEGRRRKHFD